MYCITQPGIRQCQHRSKTSSHFAGIKTKFLTTRQHTHNIKLCVVRQNDVASVSKLQDNLNDSNI